MDNIIINKPLKRVIEMIRSRMGDNANYLSRAAARMNEDYLGFFREYSETMYAMVFEQNALGGLIERLRDLDCSGATDALEYKMSNIIEDLLERPLSRNNTNPMVNIAHSIECEAKQRLLKFYKSLYEVLKKGKDNP